MDEQLLDLFGQLPKHCVILLEDIDCVATSQKCDDMSAGQLQQDQFFPETDGWRSMPVKKKPDGLSLSSLINAIDGVPAPEGHVLIMTTNHCEKLNLALIQPGCIDKEIVFGYADRAVAQDLFCSIYRTADDKIVTLAREFASYVPEHTLTPAHIQVICYFCYCIRRVQKMLLRV